MITAVVLNYNTASDTTRCVEWLGKQTGTELEIIVIDNGSETAQLALLREYCSTAGVCLVESASNGGYSAGNNIGLRLAVSRGSRWALVINPDVEIRDPDYLRALLQAAEPFPQAVVLGSDIILPDGRHQNPMRELSLGEEILWPIAAFRSRMGRPVAYLSDRRTGYCEKLAGCCFLISCSYLQAFGYLDEGLFLYCEEPVLARRVEASGHRMLYVDELTAHHMHHMSTEPPASAMQMMLSSRCYYLREYSGYGKVPLTMAVASRRCQMVMWRTINWRRRALKLCQSPRANRTVD